MANTNVFLNFVSNKLVHTATAKDGKTFYNVSFPYGESKTGFASVSISQGQKLPATKKGENGERIAVDGACSILLGAPDKVRQVSVCTKAATKKKKAEYEKVELTNAQIAEIYEASRKAYKEQKAAEEAADAPAETTAETADAPATDAAWAEEIDV